MKPLPVLYVSWMGEWGGAEIALARLVKSLDRRKFQPHAWIFKFGPLVDFMRAQSVPTRLFPALRLFQLLLNPFFHCRFSNFLKSQKIELKRGDTVYRQGDLPKGLYFVNSGLIGLVLTGATAGKEHLLRFFRQGQFFGHRALFSEEGYHGSTVALEPSVLKLVPKTVVLSIFSTYPQMLSSIVKFLSK